MNFKFIPCLVLSALLLGGCAGSARFGHAHTCPVPTRRGVSEYLCKHCHCIMQVAEREWDHPCNVCHCKKTFKECRR